MLIYIDPKILKHFSTSYLSKNLNYHLGPTKISYPGLIDHTHCLSQNLEFRFYRYGSRSRRDGVAKFLWWSCFILELPIWNDQNFRNEVLPSPLRFDRFEMFFFGLTETSNVRIFCTSWSHRDFGLVSLSWVKACNSTIFGWRLYIPLHPHLLSKRAIRMKHYLHYSFSKREPPTHVLRSRYSNPTI